MESIIHAIFAQVTDGEQKETEEITTYDYFLLGTL